MKEVFALFLFAAGVALAGNEMCTQLCEPCRDAAPDDATCANVVEVCKCVAIFDSLDAERAALEAEQARLEAEMARLEAEKAEEEARKAARVEARKSALGTTLHDECLAGKCASSIWFEGAELKAFEASEAEGFLPAEEPAFAPFENECSGLCKLAETADPANPMLAQIEASCSCKAHLEDSLKLENFRAARLANANAAADSVVNACREDEVCKVELALEGEAFALARLVKPEAQKADQNELNLAAFKAKRRAALGNSLYENCKLGRCKFQLSFEGEVGNLQSTKAQGESGVKEPSVKELSAECTELCQASAEDSESKMAAQVENSCGCQKHAQDSFKLENFRATRARNSNAAADSVVEFCAAKKTCKVELALDGETFALTRLENLEPPKPAAEETAAPAAPKFDRLELILGTILSECSSATANSTCDIRFTFQGAQLSFEAAVNPSGGSSVKPLGLSAYVREGNAALAANSVNDFCFASAHCDVDVSLDGSTRALIFVRPHEGKFPHKEQPKKAAKEKKDEQIFYKGVSLYGGMLQGEYEEDFGRLEYSWDGDGMKFGLGFLLRWYFYKWGSFQTGLNVSYTYIDLGEAYDYSNFYGLVDYVLGGSVGLSFHDISAEIPLQLRLGVPVFYLTFLFDIQKPIWNRTTAEFEGYYSGSSYRYLESDESYSTFRGIDVWSFYGFFGYGFEFTRHFTVEALFGVFQASTSDDYLLERMLVDDALTWRVKMDIAW